MPWPDPDANAPVPRVQRYADGSVVKYGWITLNWETKRQLCGSSEGDWVLYIREVNGLPMTAFVSRTSKGRH